MSILDTFFGNNKGANANMPVLPSDNYKEAVMSIKDRLAPSALEISQKDFTIGDIKGRTYFILSFPKYLNDN